MSWKLLALMAILGLLTVNVADACLGQSDNTGGDGGDGGSDGGSKGDGGDGGDGGGDGGNVEDAGDVPTRTPTALDKLGKGLDDVEEFPNDNYDGSAGNFVETGDELSCDFEDPGSCCWGNELETDDLNYLTVKGEPDQDLWDVYFKSEAQPTGNYIATAAQDAPSAIAIFASCGVKCAQDSVIVNAQAWGTGNTMLQVCLRALNDDGTPISETGEQCEPFPLGGDGSVEIPLDGPLEKFQIIFVADSFADANLGDLVVIDNIEVFFEPCDETTEAPIEETTTAGDGLCNVAQGCTYEDGDCAGHSDLATAYDGPNAEKIAPMEIHDTVDGPYSNPITGINQHNVNARGEKFKGAVIHKETPVTGQVIEFTPEEADGSKFIQYWYYAAANDQVVAICFDEFDIDAIADQCETIDLGEIAPDDRRWKPSDPYQIPEGAQRASVVSTYAKGAEVRKTASTVFGVDDLSILDNPEDACTLETRQARLARLSILRASRH